MKCSHSLAARSFPLDHPLMAGFWSTCVALSPPTAESGPCGERNVDAYRPVFRTRPVAARRHVDIVKQGLQCGVDAGAAIVVVARNDDLKLKYFGDVAPEEIAEQFDRLDEECARTWLAFTEFPQWMYPQFGSFDNVFMSLILLLSDCLFRRDAVNCHGLCEAFWETALRVALAPSADIWS